MLAPSEFVTVNELAKEFHADRCTSVNPRQAADIEDSALRRLICLVVRGWVGIARTLRYWLLVDFWRTLPRQRSRIWDV